LQRNLSLFFVYNINRNTYISLNLFSNRFRQLTAIFMVITFKETSIDNKKRSAETIHPIFCHFCITKAGSNFIYINLISANQTTIFSIRRIRFDANKQKTRLTCTYDLYLCVCCFCGSERSREFENDKKERGGGDSVINFNWRKYSKPFCLVKEIRSKLHHKMLEHFNNN
jgi:hypothetical protein